MPKPSLREELLRKGGDAIRRQGYSATGIADIAQAAAAPKGSFYNHFASKEAFGVEILNLYFASFRPLFEVTIDNTALSGAERIKRLIDGLIESINDGSWAGCLLGNFALDVAPSSEVIRASVNKHFAEWETKMRRAILAGQSDGTVSSSLAPDDAAAWFVAAWEGAVLRAKALRDPAPLLQFRRAARIQFIK